MAAGERVLVVDDDQDIRNMLASYLGNEGFEVLAVHDGASMGQALAETEFDLIVLDVLLPDENGFNIVRELRRSRNTPVILLTGKTEPVDRIVGLELGADDYVCKPFELRELLARIRGLLRRQALAGDAKPNGSAGQVANFAGWTFDPGTRALVSPAGAEVHLTSAEFDLLKILVDNAQRPVSRDQLLNATRSRNWSPTDRSIDISISRLRQKMEKDPKRPSLIKTVRNIGYVLTGAVTLTSGTRPT